MLRERLCFGARDRTGQDPPPCAERVTRGGRGDYRRNNNEIHRDGFLRTGVHVGRAWRVLVSSPVPPSVQRMARPRSATSPADTVVSTGSAIGPHRKRNDSRRGPIRPVGRARRDRERGISVRHAMRHPRPQPRSYRGDVGFRAARTADDQVVVDFFHERNPFRSPADALLACRSDGSRAISRSNRLRHSLEVVNEPRRESTFGRPRALIRTPRMLRAAKDNVTAVYSNRRPSLAAECCSEHTRAPDDAAVIPSR
jgi:hypothetical protein